MSMLVIILMWTLFGAASAYYAQIKGRDPILWFVLGALLGILSLIILFFLPAVEAKEAPPAEAEPLLVEESHQSYKSLRFADWYYMDENHHQKGPVSFTVLQRMYFDKALSLSTLVWTEGMEGWSKLGDLAELKEALGN